MPTLIVLVIAAALTLAIFILGMSLTMIFKGHHIRSEIGENPNMQKLGIKCAMQEMLEEERQLRGADACLPGIACGASSADNCKTCTTGK